MERIFANLYRFSLDPFGKARTKPSSYLLVRKQGNILICHCQRGSSIVDHMDDVEALGGIDRQFVAHYHDAKRGDLHDILYDRFGCRLCYHEAERKTIRGKTKCPEEEFGDEGLKLGSDFEAFYFPGHTIGMSIFRWKYRGKYALFPSHVINLDQGNWRISLHPEMAPHAKGHLANLAKLHIDYVFPGRVNAGEEDFHTCTEKTRKSFRRAMKERLNPRKVAEKAAPTAKRRLVTNYAPNPVSKTIANAGFDYEKMKVHGNCKHSLLMSYLERADVMYFQNFRRAFKPDDPFLAGLREFVKQGGGAYIGERRKTIESDCLAAVHPFHEVAVHRPASDGIGNTLEIAAPHPAVMMKKREQYASPGYGGAMWEPGPKGKPLAVNESGDPVLVYARIGKGRVLFSNIFYGHKTPFEDIHQHLTRSAVRWLANTSDFTYRSP